MANPLSYIAADFKRYLKAYDNKDSHKPFYLQLAIFFHNPNILFLIFYRLESYLYTNTFFLYRYLGFLLYPVYFYTAYFIFDMHIHPAVKIGKGLYLHYRGVIVTTTVKAGDDLTIIGPATIGTDLNGDKGAILGRNVTICAGAKVIGEIHIGDNVIVGANAVVVKDVPSNVVVGGIPAQILKKNDE